MAGKVPALPLSKVMHVGELLAARKAGGVRLVDRHLHESIRPDGPETSRIAARLYSLAVAALIRASHQ